MGRKAHQPTDQMREQVAFMSGIGTPQDEIALVLEMSVDTLRKYYTTELKLGKARANSKVRESLYFQAVGRDAIYRTDEIEQADGTVIRQRVKIREEQPKVLTAGIFWAKTQLGWIEKERIQLANPDDTPIEQGGPQIKFVIHEGGKDRVVER